MKSRTNKQNCEHCYILFKDYFMSTGESSLRICTNEELTLWVNQLANIVFNKTDASIPCSTCVEDLRIALCTGPHTCKPEGMTLKRKRDQDNKIMSYDYETLKCELSSLLQNCDHNADYEWPDEAIVEIRYQMQRTRDLYTFKTFKDMTFEEATTRLLMLSNLEINIRTNLEHDEDQIRYNIEHHFRRSNSDVSKTYCYEHNVHQCQEAACREERIKRNNSN